MRNSSPVRRSPVLAWIWPRSGKARSTNNRFAGCGVAPSQWRMPVIDGVLVGGEGTGFGAYQSWLARFSLRWARGQPGAPERCESASADRRRPVDETAIAAAACRFRRRHRWRRSLAGCDRARVYPIALSHSPLSVTVRRAIRISRLPVVSCTKHGTAVSDDGGSRAEADRSPPPPRSRRCGDALAMPISAFPPGMLALRPPPWPFVRIVPSLDVARIAGNRVRRKDVGGKSKTGSAMRSSLRRRARGGVVIWRLRKR